MFFISSYIMPCDERQYKHISDNDIKKNICPYFNTKYYKESLSASPTKSISKNTKSAWNGIPLAGAAVLNAKEAPAQLHCLCEI